MAETTVEHHWHDPTLGQVTKAMYQYLADSGVTETKINEVIEKKVASVLAGKVDAWVNSGRLDQLLLAAVADWASGERKAYEKNGYGYTNRVRDLVQKELQRLVLDGYNIQVTPKQQLAAKDTTAKTV